MLPHGVSIMTSLRRVAAFRLDDTLIEGMQTIWQRDGIHPSEQVRRALRDWLLLKGVRVEATTPDGSERARRAWKTRRMKYGSTGRQK